MKAEVIVSTLLGATFAAAASSCSSSYDGSFEISVADVTLAKRGVQERGTCGANSELVMTLSDGVAKDAQGRTAYIASNYQFQFDNPPQENALETSGWSICDGSELALNGNTTFYQCLSGSFYNLYNEDWAAQCSPINIVILPCSSSSASGAVSQGSDGQIVGTTVVATTIVTALSDGQPQVITTSVSVTLYTTTPVVTQISDGQVQAPTATGAVVTQISDGQVQAPTSTGGGAIVTQISDGQVQAPTSTGGGAIVTQISDGQVQAPTSTSVAAVTSAGSSSVAVVTTAAGSSSAAASATAVVSQSRSSRTVVGSIAALLLGSLVALICL
ncbi:hypothetical protein BX600DRAFT_511513 [Xylariales sp. PMI_506]|nr:hypothetical protein BX600DRAFT_511513 [Xylariales sp. PMI_506]